VVKPTTKRSCDQHDEHVKKEDGSKSDASARGKNLPPAFGFFDENGKIRGICKKIVKFSFF
jgi:hypothetical protein